MRRMFVECRNFPTESLGIKHSWLSGWLSGCHIPQIKFWFSNGGSWHLKYWPAFACYACYACCSLRKNIWIENPPCCCEAGVLVAVGIFHIVKRAPNKIVYDASFCSVFPFHVLFSWSRVGWDSSLYVPNSWVYLQIIYRWPTNRTQTKYSQYLPVYSMSIPLFRAIPGASFGASLFLGCLKRVPSTTHHWALQWAPCCLAILASLRKQFTGACSKELPLLNAVSLDRRRNHLGTFG